jgi:hypothetical protein
LETTTATCIPHVVRTTHAAQPTHTPYASSATCPMGTTQEPFAALAITLSRATRTTYPKTTPTITQPHVPLHNNKAQEKTPTYATSTFPLCSRGPTSNFLTQAQERTKSIMAASDAMTAKLSSALMPPSQDSATWHEKTLEQQRAIIRDNLIHNKTDAVFTPPTKWGTAPHVSAEAQPSIYEGPAPPPTNTPDAQESAQHAATHTASTTYKPGPWVLGPKKPTLPQPPPCTTEPVSPTGPPPVLSFAENDTERRLAPIGAEESTPPRSRQLSELDMVLAGASEHLTSVGEAASSPDPPAPASPIQASSNPAAVGAGADIPQVHPRQKPMPLCPKCRPTPPTPTQRKPH